MPPHIVFVACVETFHDERGDLASECERGVGSSADPACGPQGEGMPDASPNLLQVWRAPQGTVPLIRECARELGLAIVPDWHCQPLFCRALLIMQLSVSARAFFY